jgi:hypothetical protein
VLGMIHISRGVDTSGRQHGKSDGHIGCSNLTPVSPLKPKER